MKLIDLLVEMSKGNYPNEFKIKDEDRIYHKVNNIYINEDGKVVSIKEKKKAKELLDEMTRFKEFYNIETDDVITIVDMYFANYFNIEYIGKPLF